MTDEPSMFPEYPERRRPFQLDPADVREAISTVKPDNSAYLAAMREFRERYEQAERDMGSAVEISALEFRVKK